ncbi:Leukocyte elastase inhibitor, partial [Lamellibrachia satsuma]
VTNLTSANISFALDVYRQLSVMTPGDNIFVSPLSISAALAMTYLGARGDTASLMKNVLRLESLSDTDVHAAFGELLAALNEPNAPYILRTASRLFASRQHKFLDDFVSATRKHYGAEAALYDFVGDPEGSRLAINKWVEEQTAEKIKNLLPAGFIDSLTAIVLVNAVYFKGDWATKFDSRGTHDSLFITNAEETVNVNMMFRHDKYRLSVDSTLDCQVLRLPYVGDHLAMFVLLPRQLDGLESLEKSLTADRLHEALRGASSARLVDVDVSLPKFRLEHSCPLKDVLVALGMGDVFVAGKADLSGMDGGRELYMSGAVHKAFIDVTEEGSEAAAATAIGISLTCMPLDPVEFVADHPFLFLISDNRTGSILFLGRLARP